MRVTLVGPCHPGDIEAVPLSARPAPESEFRGYRGIPVSDLAESLWSRGHEITVVTTSFSSRPVNFFGERLTVRTVPMRRRARDRSRDFFRVERDLLRREIEASNADVVHAHWTYEFALAALAQRRPALVTIHDAPLTIARHAMNAYRTLRLALAWRVRLQDPHLTAVSPYVADQWRREMLWRGDISIIPNMVGMALTAPPEAVVVPGRVTTIGDSSRWKNLRRLLEAWPRVAEVNPALQLHVVGLDQSGATSLGVDVLSRNFERVTWHGTLSRCQVANVLARTEMLVHPSLQESFGLVVAEAMHLGVPVIGGRSSGAIPWLLDEGRAGLLTNVSRPDSIAAAILRIHGEPELREALRCSAQARSNELFSITGVAESYESIYEAI